MIACCFKPPKPNESLLSSNNNSQVPQHVVTCIYQTQLCNSPTYHMTLTWSRTLSSHSLTIHAPFIFSNSITISLNSSSNFFQNKLHTSKSIFHRRYSHKIKLHWNFSKAKFIQNSAEPHSCFYFAISYNKIVQFFMGDIHSNLKHNQDKSSNSVILSRRYHMFQNRSYVSHAVLMGSKHVIEIECKEGVVRVKVDGEIKMVVKRMAWKFRGYEKIILVEGIQVEIYWDVLLSWDDYNNTNNNNNIGHGVFVFQVGDYISGTMWPEMVGVQKWLTWKSMSNFDSTLMLKWAEENNNEVYGSNVANGFSMLSYAWTQN
ncbi:unnamed protein product [Lathyrus sativus]|nr:unnamed protein product [Lathyrus sativus]